MSATAPFTPERPTASAPRSGFAWPTWRQAWFQLHWLVGITAGSVLVVIGLSGATLMFREEILDALNPGVRHVAPRAAAVLTPDQLLQALRAARPDDRVAQITLASEPGTAARVQLAPPAGQRRGQTLWLDPYSATVGHDLRGAGFFEWVESLHRWLLLPRDNGRLVAGTLATCLLVMSVSGLYLRWPKRALDWRTWLRIDTRLTGRSFLWSLHSVLGTWALVFYLVSTSSGIYWAFESVRDTVDGWLSVARPAQPMRTPSAAAGRRRGAPASSADDSAAPPVELAPTWAAFQQRAGRWTQATLRLPQRPTQPLDINWLAAGAPHERARNRMLVQAGGEIAQDERYEQGGLGTRLQSTIYPLHMGTYFGLPGRIGMSLAALMLPVFAITGWMLYLKRRHAGQAARRERMAFGVVAAAERTAPWLIVYASQTGQAERLAWRTAASLAEAGIAARVESTAGIDPARLDRQGPVLLVASSFGEGDAPDSAKRFMRRLLALDVAAQPLAGLRFGLLALGDRRHVRFCGFGHALDAALRARGGRPMFPLVEVDDGEADGAALARWAAALTDTAGASLSLAASESRPDIDTATWTLSRRQLLNPGSQGGPLHALTLTSDRAADWQPGALVDIVPRQAPQAVVDWLTTNGLAHDVVVRHGGHQVALVDLLARSEWPAMRGAGPAQAVADALVPLAPRRYSVASIPEDAAVELLVRQERHPDGLGIASGWLTVHAAIGASIELAWVPNPSFAPMRDDRPCVYIGNGSGLAGLRSHLRDRVRDGRRANWLLFGERERAHDRPCADEIAHWQSLGFLERVDLVFSRDPPRRTWVQDRLREAEHDVRAWVDRGACVFVCGSLHGMSAGVDAALRDILGADGLDDLIAAGRLRRDVY